MSFNKGPSYQQDLEQLGEYVEKYFKWFSGRGNILYIIIIIVVLVLWLASGVYVVQPGEEGVERTFGQFSSVTTPGLNYRWPWPVQSVTIVDVESVRREEIGFRTDSGNRKEENLSEALMLTEDENIVQVELLVQYRIADSSDRAAGMRNYESRGAVRMSFKIVHYGLNEVRGHRLDEP